jgi:uncharacterized protein (TIGR02099 family)
VLSIPNFPRLTRWLNHGIHALSWVLLVLGLLLGLAWGVLHLWIVPRIADYRPALERLAQQTMGVPVRIGALSAQSTGWVPSFELRRIELLDAQGRPGLILPRVVLAISVRSVLRLRLEQLVLDAPELDIRLTAAGQWQIAGLDLPSQSQGDSAAADWLFSQNEVLIRGGTVRWTNERAQRPLKAQGKLQIQDKDMAKPETLALREVDLVLRNSTRFHDLRLDATPPEAWGTRFVTVGRFKRGLLSTHAAQFSDWSGQAYAYFPKVDVAQLRKQVQLGADVQSGQGALRLWSDFEKGQWTGGAADTDLTDVNIRLDPQHEALAFERLSGRVSAQVLPQQFTLGFRDLSFISAEGLHWPGGNLNLSYTHEQVQARKPAQGRLQGDHIDLQALRDLSLRLPLPSELHRQLQATDVTGQVDALQLSWIGDWRQPQSYDAQASLKKLNLPAPAGSTPSANTPSWPGLQGAQVQLKMTQAGGQVQIDMSEDGAVVLPGILEEPKVGVNKLHAQARWQRKDGLWAVPQWSLQLDNADLSGQWQGQWQGQAQGLGVLELQGLVSQANAARVHRYLPVTLPSTVRQYVRDAVVKGSYTGVQIHIKGALDRLPFANPKEGEFRFAGRLNGVELDYLPASLLPRNNLPWPRLHDLSGQLVFDRLGMKLSDASARAGEAKTGMPLNAIQARIANMAEQATLEVSGEQKGPAAQVLGLIQKSPIDKYLNSALRDMQATGSVQTRIKLNIPLLATQNTKVQGAVVLGGNDLRTTPGLPVFEKVQGTVQFSDSGFSLNGVQARLLGGPIRMEGGLRANSSNEPALQLRAQGEISAEGLRQAHEFHPLDVLAKQMSGATAYTASLGWRQGQPELFIQSQLEGLGMKLPAPLTKASAMAMPLSIRSRVQGTGANLQDRLQIDLGRVAAVQYVRDLSGQTPRVLRGSMSLGNTAGTLPPMPDAGVAATVAMDQLSVDEWQALWPAAPTTGATDSDNAAMQSYLPTRIGLQANSITAEGRTLHQVVAGGTRDGLTWRANVDARELSGHLAFHQSSGGQPGQLYARLARLNLPPSSAADVESLLETPPAHLPALDIVIEQLELRGMKLGRIEIEAVNSALQTSGGKPSSEWRLNKFNIILPEATLSSTGRWLSATAGSPLRKTEMNFRLSVRDAGDLLTRLGTPGALRDGSGLLDGQISWSGSPLTLHYPSMSGQFDVKMGRGQFLKADAGAAKLLGVLSLQALPRRFLLDFRDVFYEGFAFDSVAGRVSIDQGIATTRNLQIKGINAIVQLDGSADIAKETQQLRVVILPEVDTGTASLVAGLAVNPLVGLTTFLAQLFLQSPLSRASTQEFLIDGSWTTPRVKRVERDASQSAAPGK